MEDRLNHHTMGLGLRKFTVNRFIMKLSCYIKDRKEKEKKNIFYLIILQDVTFYIFERFLSNRRLLIL
jgi:hypothetical protein